MEDLTAQAGPAEPTVDDQTGPFASVFGPVIFAYTRAMAIADGVLHDVPAEVLAEAGFTNPVAITDGLWHDAVAWTDHDTEETGAPQDEAGRLWDVLTMTRYNIARLGGRPTTRIPVRLDRVPRHSRTGRALPLTFWAEVGPGDSAEPVMTLMLEGED